MPTYEYRCEACKHEFEQYQSITAAPLRKCPACGQRALQRLLGTGGGIIFKGSGFYQTDYRSESYKKAAAAEKSAKTPVKSDKDSGAKSAGKSVAGETAKPTAPAEAGRRKTGKPATKN